MNKIRTARVAAVALAVASLWTQVQAATAWREGPEGVPVLDGVLARTVCAVVARVPAGDHRIVLAEVLLGDHTGPGRPLVHHQGRFRALRD